MNKNNNEKYVFLDFDGVMTSFAGKTGSYETHEPEQYSVTPECLTMLKILLERTGAKVVITSMWRTKTGSWPYSGRTYMDPLESLTSQLSETEYAGMLSHEIIKKGDALRAWFDDHGLDKRKASYVVLDDVLRFSGYLTDEDIARHCLEISPVSGLTPEDVERAIEILNGKLNKKGVSMP